MPSPLVTIPNDAANYDLSLMMLPIRWKMRLCSNIIIAVDNSTEVNILKKEFQKMKNFINLKFTQ
jgi:hypothetical protein